MAMAKKTRNIIEGLREAYEGKTLDRHDWNKALGNDLTFETFRKYVLNKVIEEIEVPLEEIVNLLNDCAGNDCYECEWEYVVKDGKIYEIVEKFIWNKG